MKNAYFNQKINCDVTICKFYDKEHAKCTLGSITVGNKNQNETFCENYEKNELK